MESTILAVSDEIDKVDKKFDGVNSMIKSWN